jgi:type II secretory pathway component PulJ
MNSSYPFAVAFLFLADGGDKTAAIVGTVFAFLTLVVTRYYDSRERDKQRVIEQDERAAHLKTIRSDIKGAAGAERDERADDTRERDSNRVIDHADRDNQRVIEHEERAANLATLQSDIKGAAGAAVAAAKEAKQ